MEHIACDQCGGADLSRVYEQPDTLFDVTDWFSIVACAQCGLGFVNPRPSPQEMSRYYPVEFFLDFEQPNAHLRRYKAQAALLQPAVTGGGPPLLLDIGCANGGFPRYMRNQGWQVEGLEIAPNALAIEDFPVYRMPLPQLPFDTPRYDAVTAWAVLEHVHDPRAYFEKISAILKPGGRFVFVVTNFASLSSRALFNEDIPRHLYFFTENTLRSYLAGVGLQPEKILYDDAIFEMTPVNILYYLWSKIRGRPFLWRDSPESRHLYGRRKGLKRSPGTTLRYALTHPLAAIDRCAAVLFARCQMQRKNYGIITVIASKPQA